MEGAGSRADELRRAERGRVKAGRGGVNAGRGRVKAGRSRVKAGRGKVKADRGKKSTMRSKTSTREIGKAERSRTRRKIRKGWQEKRRAGRIRGGQRSRN